MSKSSEVDLKVIHVARGCLTRDLKPPVESQMTKTIPFSESGSLSGAWNMGMHGLANATEPPSVTNPRESREFTNLECPRHHSNPEPSHSRSLLYSAIPVSGIIWIPFVVSSGASAHANNAWTMDFGGLDDILPSVVLYGMGNRCN